MNTESGKDLRAGFFQPEGTRDSWGAYYFAFRAVFEETNKNLEQLMKRRRE